MLALISHYLDLVRTQFLSGSMPSLLKETQTVNQLAFELYKVPEQLDYVCELATALIHLKDPAQVVKETYCPDLIKTIDADDLREYAALLTYEKAKIVLAGKEVLSNEAVITSLGTPLSEIKKDHWFHSKHRIYRKPVGIEACL